MAIATLSVRGLTPGRKDRGYRRQCSRYCCLALLLSTFAVSARRRPLHNDRQATAALVDAYDTGASGDRSAEHVIAVATPSRVGCAPSSDQR